MAEDLKCNRLGTPNGTSSDATFQSPETVFAITLYHSKFINSLTSFSKLNLNCGLTLFILFGLFFSPLVSSQAFDLEDFGSDYTQDVVRPVLNKTNSSDSLFDLGETYPNVGTPRAEGVKKNQRTTVKCPKKYRHSWCFNKGKCHWIEDLEEPSCRCKKNWEGPRCEDPLIEFASDEDYNNQDIIIIAVVISVVVLTAVMIISCICWRRMKNVKKALELEEVEKGNGLLSEKTDNQDTLSAVEDVA